ncbi:MAG: hypothetical protein WBO73_00240 [Gammaproteobacteria bacterium]|jgi:hypothetical protein
MDNTITLSIDMSPAEPLWKIAPTRDENGNRVGDFLMIIPRLRHKPEHHIKRTLNDIDRALKQFKSDIVFANMDMKLNTLWVSFKPEPGLFMEIAAAIKLQVPEAVLVGDMSSRITR